MPAYFVTATGTDIGKTYVSAALLSAWRRRGLSTVAVKPVMSGFGEDALEQSDAGRLITAMGGVVTAETVSDVCLYRLEPPLAPNIAMRLAGVTQDYGAIVRFCRSRLDRPAHIHLIEGAGGIMSPLTDDTLQLDLMRALGLPVLLVTAPYLGSISHTLTAIDALAAAGLTLAALIVSEPVPQSADLALFADEVSRFRPCNVALIPHGGSAGDLAAALANG
ncbi:MAG: dethiobiotin synthase [Hyphomonas sp.]